MAEYERLNERPSPTCGNITIVMKRSLRRELCRESRSALLLAEERLVLFLPLNDSLAVAQCRTFQDIPPYYIESLVFAAAFVSGRPLADSLFGAHRLKPSSSTLFPALTDSQVAGNFTQWFSPFKRLALTFNEPIAQSKILRLFSMLLDVTSFGPKVLLVNQALSFL